VSELGERFQGLRLLGRGGMACVYAAHDAELDCDVALKVLYPHVLDEAMFGRLRREVVLARRVVHSNVVRLYDVLATGDQLVLSMELLQGGSLRDWLAQHGALDPAPALRVLRQVAAGLDAAHRQGILHRDIKPHNVLLTPGRDQAKLADFGLAVCLAESGQALTFKGSLLGTPQYMAPEVYRGDLYDPRSDLYSFGVLAYEVLTGRRPFQGSTPFELCHQHCVEPPEPPGRHRPELPAALEALVLRCLAKTPEERFQATAELLAALDAAEAELKRPAAASPAGAPRQQPAAAAEPDSGSPSSRGSRRCPGCGETVPPQLASCPFCAAAGLPGLDRGRWAVLLLPAVSEPLLRQLLQWHAMSLPQLYRAEAAHKALEVVAQASGELELSGRDREEALRRFGTLPCLLLDRLERQDAQELAGRLERIGVRAEVRRLDPASALALALAPHSSAVRKAVSACLRLSGAAFHFSVALSLALGRVPPLAIGIFAALFLPGVGLAWLRYRRPLSSIVPLLRGRASGAADPASEEVLAAARRILPQLQDSGIRRIAVSLMSSMAALHGRLDQVRAVQADAWLRTALELALEAQQSRAERLAAGAGGGSSPAARRETRCLVQLLQLRARVDLVLARLDLDSARRAAVEDAELESLAAELAVPDAPEDAAEPHTASSLQSQVAQGPLSPSKDACAW
jgi:hypothetical protein